MQKIASDSKVLEVNTGYCYLVYCKHFGQDGCIVAERVNEDNEREIVGYVQGYRPPTHRDTVFVWQIGVSETVRGQGIGGVMLKELFNRVSLDGVRYLEATVTPSNLPSRKLFRGFARDMNTKCEESPYFSCDNFALPGASREAVAAHESEDLFRIGPVREAGKRVVVN